MQKAFSNEQLEPLIFTIRGYRVVLDSDLARVYGISTKHLNQAVRRNSTRFPHDFAFQLKHAEVKELRSQIVTSTSQPVESVPENQNRSPYVNPWAFTEHGALMAANILRIGFQ